MSNEVEEIEYVEDDVIGVWNWIGYLALCMIPIINIIPILVVAFGKSKSKTMVNYARAVIILTIIIIALAAAFAATCATTFLNYFQM